MIINAEQLDKEHKGRIDELAAVYDKGTAPSVVDIVSSSSVAQQFDRSKIILPSYNLKNILLAYPFVHEIYVPFCPYCIKDTDLADIKTLLGNSAITPVLIAPYSKYPESIIRVVATHPHLSMHEFLFLRYMMLTIDRGARVCGHCIEARRKEYISAIRGKYNVDGQKLISELFQNLHPYIKPDYELIEDFGKALRVNNTKKLDHVRRLSKAFWDIRTAQALKARPLLSSRAIPRVIENADLVMQEPYDNFSIESTLAQDIGIEIPQDIDIDAYLKCVAPYRKDLTDITCSLITEGANSQSKYLTIINSRLGDLRQQVLALDRSKLFLTYRATWGFLQSNKALIGSLIIASAFALKGNLVGCGIGPLTMAGAHIARKCNKLKIPEDMNKLCNEIKHSIRPFIQKYVAKYSEIDIRAIQLYEINDELRNTIPQTASLLDSNKAKKKK